MFVAEGGLRRNKLSTTSFLFGVSIRHNNPRKTQQPAFDMNITLGKFGTRGLETQTTTQLLILLEEIYIRSITTV
jgi:hypothetical protein